MRILIVEDDLLFATRLEAMLSETPFHFAYHRNSADKAFLWLTKNTCDVAMIDIHR